MTKRRPPEEDDEIASFGLSEGDRTKPKPRPPKFPTVSRRKGKRAWVMITQAQAIRTDLVWFSKKARSKKARSKKARSKKAKKKR